MTRDGAVRERAREAADQFDAALLHNVVYEQVQGQREGATVDVETIVALAERCYALSDRCRDDSGDSSLHSTLFDAGEAISSHIDDVVDEATARGCATVLLNAGEWTDAWDAGAINAAQAEAARWISTHLDAAERAGVVDDALLHEIAAAPEVADDD